jgi:ribosome maturation factor RimP
LQVSSPGAERLLKVPEDLDRFKDMAMRVQYHVEGDNDLVARQNLLKDGIFLLELVDVHAEHCVWKLADVKENRAEAGKGRPLNRKQRDWRLQTSFQTVKKATLYLDSN